MNVEIIQLAEKLAAGGRNVVFTGAGISTESGISDYRSKGGIWDRFQPIYFDEFMSSEKARIEYWRRKCALYAELGGAVPNSAHYALTELYEKNLLELVITQNIDGLHQASGLPEEKVIELHGNTNRVRCMSCDTLVPLNKTLERISNGELAPKCPCGGYLKPDTISFGQSLREEDLTRAMIASQNCDLFLGVGSTMIVQPASLMPEYARYSGAFLAIINLSETPYDDACNILIRDSAGRVLSDIVRHIQTLI